MIKEIKTCEAVKKLVKDWNERSNNWSKYVQDTHNWGCVLVTGFDRLAQEELDTHTHVKHKDLIKKAINTIRLITCCDKIMIWIQKTDLH